MPAPETTVLVLQGGGALGAYQAGAYAALSERGAEPDWVAGISIGAINGAILCGNPPDRRADRLAEFWRRVSAGPLSAPWFGAMTGRRLQSEFAAASVAVLGAPGFFSPRPLPDYLPPGLPHTVSVYDTAPLRRTLEELVDFDYLNAGACRLAVGAVDVQTGNFAYFDSARQRIGPEHVMASGALPPGLPPVEIDGRLYWDGGLVSNTPLQYVFETAGDAPLLIFQVDLFSARGAAPETLADVDQRQKDIRYSSRTRLTTDRYRQLHALRAAADRLAARLPPEMADDPDLALLRAAGPGGEITLVHLIHRLERFETSAKDYDFSRLSMQEHWASGVADVARTFDHPDWRRRHRVRGDGIRVFDLAGPPR